MTWQWKLTNVWTGFLVRLKYPIQTLKRHHHNQKDNTKLQLVANDYGIIYIGTIVKTIIDLLSTQFGGLSVSAIGNEILDRKIREVISQYFATQDLKKCPNCQSENRGDAKYCDNCGHKFL